MESHSATPGSDASCSEALRSRSYRSLRYLPLLSTGMVVVVVRSYRGVSTRKLLHVSCTNLSSCATAAVGVRSQPAWVPLRNHGALCSGARGGIDCRLSQAAPRSESLARAATLGLAEVGDLSREPRQAIIACYLAMERQLGNVPDAVPQDFDTASEVLARAVEHRALQTDSAVPLVDLFAEARFSPHVMNEGHRDMAVRALQLGIQP
jgi:hypothetical protein